MTFHSILFESDLPGIQRETTLAPGFFADLYLDQVVTAIARAKQGYNLAPFFYTPLHAVETILYRQAVMQDLENEQVFEAIRAFAEKMVVVRRYLSMIEKLDYPYHKEGWFLEAAELYCQAITNLAHDLGQSTLASSGMLAFREYLTGYAASELFTRLQADAQQLKAALATVEYCIILKGDQVRVRRYQSEIDYSTDVLATFDKFKQGAVKDYRVKLSHSTGMNHIEARILEFVARLYPAVFARLDCFWESHGQFLDPLIANFDREIQFYVAYLEYIAAIKHSGLKFCYPQVTTDSKEVYDYEGYDLALAYKLILEKSPVVSNDFALHDPERILVVSGPNQGGKTTFARTFGQLHYLASLGCPVPGREARLFLFDQLFTHFEREEDIRNLRGKLQDDLVRIYQILEQATPASIVIINEIFNSTTTQDAVFLGQKILERISELDLLCVYVTFIDELSRLSEKTVSMVSTIIPENPAMRTYKIVRKPADGLAFALSIAEKYRLTYASLKERIR